MIKEQSAGSIESFLESDIPSERIRPSSPSLLLIRKIVRKLKRLSGFEQAGPKLREIVQLNEQQLANSLYLGIQYLYEAGVAGEIAEFGTLTGKSSAVLSNAILQYDQRFAATGDKRFLAKQLLLFDTFKGLPPLESTVDYLSPHVQSGLWGPHTNLGLDRESLRKLCERHLSPERVQIQEGLLRDTIKSLPPQTKLAFAHICCKLYQPTVEVVEYLLTNGLLAEGAVLYFSDWNPNHASPELGQRKAWAQLVDKYNVSFSDWGAFGWSGQRFIIHSYARAPKWVPPWHMIAPSESEDEVLRELQFGVEYVCGADVPGEIAEFGTFTGRSASAIAAAISDWDRSKPSADGQHNNQKVLMLFDSFEGLPESESEIDRDSPHVKSGVWGPGLCQLLSMDGLRAVCEQFIDADRVMLFKGWFKDTVPKIKPGTKFAMLHVDCDLYQSTIDCLEFILANGMLSEGAAVFFDDWNPNRASPRHGERKAWSELVERYSIDFSDWGSYGWSGKKFIVHSYQASR
jgi:hypothetical protein